MAVYKVIQDIEAEDRLVGFLTLKGFVYAAIAGMLAFINIRLAISGSIGMFKYVFIFLFLPPMVLFIVLALPLGHEQPTESWLLSHIRFYLKSRKRIWDQRGSRVHVTVTAPKKIERQLTDNLSQSEVSSRLKSLALTLDTRGWAVKNVNVNLNPSSQYDQILPPASDRLVEASSAEHNPLEDIEVKASDDIMDPHNNPVARHFENLMKKAESARKSSLQHIIGNKAPSKVSKEEPQTDFQHVHEIEGSQGAKEVRPLPASQRTAPEESLHFKKKLKKAEIDFLAKRNVHSKADEIHHAKTTKSLAQDHAAKPAPIQAPKPAPQQRSTGPSRADKLELAQSGNDLSVASIAHLANRPGTARRIGPNEVEISLH